MEDRWLSVNEIAEYLGVTRDSIYRWIEHRNMPGHRVGRRWKFLRTEIDQWVRSGGADERRTLASKDNEEADVEE